MSCRRKNVMRHKLKVYKSIFYEKLEIIFWMNICGKTRLNFKEYTNKAISQNWEFSQKKLGYHVKSKNPLYLLMILTSISSKIGEESKSYTKFINFNEFFSAKKSAKAIPPNWYFFAKIFGGCSVRCQKPLYFLAILIKISSKIDEESKYSSKIILYSILKVTIISCRRTNVRRHETQHAHTRFWRNSLECILVLERHEKEW